MKKRRSRILIVLKGDYKTQRITVVNKNDELSKRIHSEFYFGSKTGHKEVNLAILLPSSHKSSEVKISLKDIYL